MKNIMKTTVGLTVLALALLIWAHPLFAITIGVKLIELCVIGFIANVISRVFFKRSLRDFFTDEDK